MFAGFDSGSRAVKCVIIDDDGDIVASGFDDQGVEQQKIMEALFERLLHNAGILRDDIKKTVATGYGRTKLKFADMNVTEITCHAKGVRHMSKAAMSIIEIGGQDSKFIHLDENGSVKDFAMNDRCASGTGRFLEMVATQFLTNMNGLGKLAIDFIKEDKQAVSISSTCAVFAESEIVGLLAEGVELGSIAVGVQNSIARRIRSMAGNSVSAPIVFTGGVANVGGMKEALEKVFNENIEIVENAKYTGALGAALIARARHNF
jgi:predicted CoA-substrate-specific enzyme activase